MPERNLDADLAICEAATPGPWRSTWGDPRPAEPPCEGRDDRLAVITSDGGFIVGMMFYDHWWPGCSEPNSAFIAVARTGWPDAIRRAQSAERELKEACVLNCEMKELFDKACDQRDRAEKLLVGAKAMLSGKVNWNPAFADGYHIVNGDGGLTLDEALERAAELAEKEQKV